MSLLVTFNGANYIIPTTNEVGWGSNLDSYFVAIAAGCLQKTGGLFTLSAETDFGSSFGLTSLYYKSRSSNVASTGNLRLANTDVGVTWRNAANNADLPLTVNASNQLTFNGNVIETSTGIIELADGSVGAPSLAFLSNPTTGIYKVATDNMGFAIANALAFSINSDRQIVVPKTSSQIVLGDPSLTHVTLSAPAPLANRTYTIPDVQTNSSFTLKPTAPGDAGVANRSTQVFDFFDRADSALKASFTPTGQQWALTGLGFLTATVTDGMYVNTDNTYAFLDYVTAIPRISGAFSFVPGSGTNDPSVVTLALIADTDGNLSTMLHLQISPTSWVLEKRVSGTFSPLLTGTYPLETDGTIYGIAYTINGGTVTVYPPMGPVQTITDSDVAAMTCHFGAWQITQDGTGLGGSGGFKSRWNAVTMGAQEAVSLHALGAGMPASASNHLVNTFATQTIAGAKTFSSPVGISAASSVALLLEASFVGSLTATIKNDSTTSGANSRLNLVTSGNTNCNPFIKMSTSSADWAVGVSRNDGDEFVISNSGTLDTNNYLVINTSGAIEIPVGSVTIDKTTNQLILGTTHTTTITAPAPSASRVYTIPDAGGTASFLMSGSGQIVNADISATAAIALSKLAALTTARALQSNASTGFIEVSSVTNTELGYLSGVTSAIQTQFAGVVHLAGTETITGAKSFSAGVGITLLNQSALEFVDGAGTHGMIFQAPSTFTSSLSYLLPASPPAVNGAVMSSTTGGTMSWASIIGVANGGTGVGTLAAHGVLIGNGTGNVTVSSTGSSGQVLTSNGASADPTFQTLVGTGTVNSGTQFQLAYYATSTNAVSGLTLITASRALASDTNGLPVASATTASELGFVSGVTSAIQTQLNAKAPLASPTFTGTLTVPNVAITDTTNQMVLGTTRTVTITAPTPATTSRTWTIPDITGNGTFAALEGTQTFSGTKTFSAEVTVNDLVLTAANAGAVLTSSQSSSTEIFYRLSNTNATSTANATLFLTAATSGGNAGTRYTTGTTTWKVGSDAADSSKFKVSQNTEFGTNDYFIINATTKAAAIHGTNTNDSATAGFVGEIVSSISSTPVAISTSATYQDFTSISLTAGDWDIEGEIGFDPNTMSQANPSFLVAISAFSGNTTTDHVIYGNVFKNGSFAIAPGGVLPVVAPRVRFSLSTTTTIYLKGRVNFTSGSPNFDGGNITARRVR